MAKMFSHLLCDGTPQRLDHLTGHKNVGDLYISYGRTPLTPEQGKPFDGVLTLRMASGGLIETSDLYNYDAPDSGYQASVALAMPANAKLGGGVHRCYYTFDGRRYGRIILDFSFGDVRNVYSDLRSYVNFSGSRNLEIPQGTHPFP